MSIVTILQIILAILVFIIFCLIGIYVLIMYVNKKKEEEPEEEEETVDESLGTFRGLSKESIYKFMEFDEIKDNMIVRKNRNILILLFFLVSQILIFVLIFHFLLFLH